MTDGLFFLFAHSEHVNDATFFLFAFLQFVLKASSLAAMIILYFLFSDFPC